MKNSKVSAMSIEEPPSPETDEKSNKFKHYLFKMLNIFGKPIGLLGCLYFFICSLDTMSSSFRLIAGKYTSEVFQQSELLTNPLAALMMGVLGTVVVQSSSTSTSIVVSMVASQILEVRHAIPIVMGANIGTSITSALVSLGQVGNRENFKRAFSGATVHDMFNCLTVMVLLPVEVATRYLEKTTQAVVNQLIQFDINAKEPELLQALTKPFTGIIIQLDKDVLKNISIGAVGDNVELRKHVCKKTIMVSVNETMQKITEETKCRYMFESVNWPEWVIGIILLVLSLVVLIVCLIIMVKILNSVFVGPVAKLMQTIINSDFPGPFRYLTPYFAIFLGCILTIIVQSSSVFMSTLTPLVGVGVVTLERVFPLALGANIGTTVTGILAAFSASPDTIKYSLQIALCHTLFNVTGIIIWYPIPYLRQVPLGIARLLGETTSQYRWFTIIYLVGLFLVIPMTTFALSLAGLVTSIIVLVPMGSIAIAVIVLNVLQRKMPRVLPESLKTWNFLPEFLHSLDFYDRLIMKYCICCSFAKANQVDSVDNDAELGTLQEMRKTSCNGVYTNEAFSTHL